MNDLDRIMGTEEASKLWGLKQDYIKNLCREGKVVAKLIGRTWILDKEQPNPGQPTHPKNWRGRKKEEQ